ncbi:MAG: UrcA family protein, partial [Caulobacteraceae bacterium]|nr:UrcA family protein [Caulobacteraceae bacterium]
LVLVAGAASARVGDPVRNDDGSQSVTIGYTDLDLASEAGGHAMLHRIHNAARTACGPEPSEPLEHRFSYEPCVAKTVNKAVARLGNPIVTALNSGKSASGAFVLASR